MDERGDAVLCQPERRCRRLIVDLTHIADLDEMIAGPQGPDLRTTPLQRPLRDLVGVGAVDAAARFDPIQILGPAVTVTHRPGRPLFQHLGHLFSAELEIGTRGANAGRDHLIQTVHEPGQARAQVVRR